MQRLLETLKNLRDLGNTVIVVEHDEEAIRAADHVDRYRPRCRRPWRHATSSPKGRPSGSCPKYGRDSTDRPLPGRTGRMQIAVPHERRRKRQEARIIGCACSVLPRKQPEGRRCRDPLGLFRLRHGGVGQRQVDADHRHLLPRPGFAVCMRTRAMMPGGAPTGSRGIERISTRSSMIDQSPIGRTPRSNPATYTGCFTPIREWSCRPAGSARFAWLQSPGTLLVQRQGWPLRGLPGRRCHQDRDALPARRLRYLRRLQGQPASIARPWRCAYKRPVDRRTCST